MKTFLFYFDLLIVNCKKKLIIIIDPLLDILQIFPNEKNILNKSKSQTFYHKKICQKFLYARKLFLINRRDQCIKCIMRYPDDNMLIEVYHIQFTFTL